jgi:hypothetical protein
VAGIRGLKLAISGFHVTIYRLALLLICRLAWAADSQTPAAGGAAPETMRAFDAYARLTESRLDALVEKQDGFL